MIKKGIKQNSSNYRKSKRIKGRFRLTEVIRPLFFSVFLSSLVWYFCRHFELTQEPSITMPHSLSDATVSPPPETYYQPITRFFTHIIKPGETFSGVLSKFQISEKDASQYYALLRAIGLRAIFPGDSLVIQKDENDNITLCSLLNRFNYWYHVFPGSDMIRTEKETLGSTVHQCIIKGTLKTSLSEDMNEYGISDALVFKFADVFAWDINFFMDPQRGDTFEVFFEKNYREGHFTGYGSILAAKYVSKNVPFYAIGLRDSTGAMLYYDLDGNSVQKQFLKAPLRFHRISSGFSYSRKHPVLGIYRPHLGVDYAAPRGTPVYAASDGVIIATGWKGQYGKHVRISHGASYETFYGHLHTIATGVEPKIRVKQGQLIGTVGATGLATGPHLDYRMKVNGRFVDPTEIKLPSGKSVSPDERSHFECTKQLYLSVLETRFSDEGCFVVSVTQPDSSKVVVSKITRIKEGNDDES